MDTFEDILRLLRCHGTAANSGGPGTAVPPITPEGREVAKQAAREALAPKQSDETHLIIRPLGPDGGVLQQSEEWTHGEAGLKVVKLEVRVATCTGELVEPKKIRVACSVCGGYDSVVNHCRCGKALCRLCLRHDPCNNAPLCPLCYQRALETFNTWAAHDRQQTKERK